MIHSLPQTLFTTILASGLSAIAFVPANASGIQGVTIGGTAPNDYLLYDATATETYLNPSASLQTILGGSAGSPTGNVELAASSEKSGFDFTKVTTLNGTIGGRAIGISSLTQSDWDIAYKGQTFGQYWFDKALAGNGLGQLASTSTGTALFNIFKTNGGFQRFSDPNISYVNQSTDGKVSIGLAGHYNASPLLLFRESIEQYIDKSSLTKAEKATLTALKGQLSTKTTQASEVFKYNYNGLTDYGYSFKATASGLTEKGDKISHTGNYEVVLAGPPPRRVPEPGVLLSLAGVAAVGWKRRKSKSV